MRIFVGAEPNLQPPLSHLLPLNRNRRASPSSWGKMGQRTTRHRLTFLWERHRTTVPAGTLSFSLYLACRDARRLHRPDGMFPNVLYFNFTQPSGKHGFKKEKTKERSSWNKITCHSSKLVNQRLLKSHSAFPTLHFREAALDSKKKQTMGLQKEAYLAKNNNKHHAAPH